MRALFLICFLFLSTLVGARPLFSSEGLYQWYEKLYAFEDVGLQHPLLAGADQVEKDFAALNYHWWQLLSGDGGTENSAAIEQLSNKYLHAQSKPKACSDQQLFMAVIASSFEARVQMMQSNSFSSAQAYISAIPYLKMLLEKRVSYDEFHLLASIYEACINEVSGRIAYMPLLLLLPESRDPKAFEKLQNTSRENAICRIEAAYFSYKIASNLKEDHLLAKKQLQRLTTVYPGNLVFQIERLRLITKTGEPGQVNLRRDIKKKVANSHRSQNVKDHFTALLGESRT